MASQMGRSDAAVPRTVHVRTSPEPSTSARRKPGTRERSARPPLVRPGPAPRRPPAPRRVRRPPPWPVPDTRRRAETGVAAPRPASRSPFSAASGVGGQGGAGETLGLGPQPGGSGGIASPARRPDRSCGPDEPEPPARTVVATVDRLRVGRRVSSGSVPGPTSREGRMLKLLNGVRFGSSRPRSALAVCRLVRVNPGWAALLIRFQPCLVARSARCRVSIRSASLDCA